MKYCLSILLVTGLAGALLPTLKAEATLDDAPTQILIQDGLQYYERGQYQKSLDWLRVRLSQTQSQGDRLAEAATWSNLALVYGELGQWDNATQSIQSSQEILSPLTDQKARLISAKVLNISGQLEYQKGNAEKAISIWQESERSFTELENKEGLEQSRLNQAYALQSLGFYRRSLIILSDLESDILTEALTRDKADRLRTLGVALGAIGNFERAQDVLKQSVAIATQLNFDNVLAQGLIALGNLNSSEGNYEAASSYYQRAQEKNAQPSTLLDAELNELRSLIELKQRTNINNRWPQLLEKVSKSDPTSDAVQAQLNLAHSLRRIRQNQLSDDLTPIVIARLLASAQQNAKKLGDVRLESYSLGLLARLYEDLGQLDEARRLSLSALTLVDEQLNGEIAYLWHWQLGRIAQRQGQTLDAIAAYGSSVQLIQGLRQELVSSQQDNQFDFRDQVEPLYREYVSVLLSSPNPSADDLEQARQAMESLQLAELDNFFRAACLDVTPVIVDQIDPSAAIVYPIVLNDKLAVVLRLPDEPLQLFISDIEQSRIDWLVDRLRLSLKQTNSTRYYSLGEELYDALLRPAMNEIRASKVKGLVFVPDGELRNIPFGALYTGDRFLVEDYAVSVTPGLHLLQAGNDVQGNRTLLVGALTEANGNEPPIPGVLDEVKSITQNLRHKVLLNEKFTHQNMEKAIATRPSSIMHFATHGQFSSELEDTYLVTGNGENLDISQLRGLLRDAELRYQTSLELLVLSACDTATGDDRAILGLAGLATRSGAKSTLASLWRVSDEATPPLMDYFYKALSDPSVSKAEALQMAQKEMIKHPEFGKHPYYWSAFILVGDWQ